MKNNFDNTFQKISIHYDKLFDKYGSSVKSSQQSSRVTQIKRMKILTKNIIFKKNDKVFDFGCGTGYLLNFLKKQKKFKGIYHGCDISEKIISYNIKKFKSSKVLFLNQNILKKKLYVKYDYIFINGTFNNYTGNNMQWMKKILIKLIVNTKKKLIFNNLSRYVDYKDNKLFYADPSEIFDFCKKKLSKNVSINHSYSIKKGVIPYEFTTIVSKFSE